MMDEANSTKNHAENAEVAPETEPEAEPEAPAEAPKSKDDEIRELREQLMRVQADFENAEKRRERDANQSRKYLLESFIRELLEVKDNLERVMAGLTEEDAAYEGLSLVVNHVGRVFASHSVEEISPSSGKFDPELHEAMSQQDSDEHAANEIISVVQKGYRLHERLLRPARVIVASGKASGGDGKGDAP